MKKPLSRRNLVILLFVILILVLILNQVTLQRVNFFLTPARSTEQYEILQRVTGCKQKVLSLRSLQYGGNYWLLENLYRGSISVNVKCASTITMTTHGDFTFLDNLTPLLIRWQAPISIALFAPGSDMNATLTTIQYVRYCLPDSALIRQYVSFHIFFPLNHLPTIVPRNDAEAHSWPYDCNQDAPYMNVNVAELYKVQNNLTYPINVARNIARKAANTHFVLPSDIELYASPQLVVQFLNMIERNPELAIKGSTRKVYPVPIFEVDITQEVPRNKTVLLQLLQSKLLTVFHSRFCSNCHLVPNHSEWLSLPDTEEMSVLTVGKRHDAFKHWEPIFISDNREPYYDERLSWEGENDKKVQGFALCQLDYEFHVLHPPFLVHRPGIKRTRRHNKHAIGKTNYLVTKVIKPQYILIYGNSSKCAV